MSRLGRVRGWAVPRFAALLLSLSFLVALGAGCVLPARGQERQHRVLFLFPDSNAITAVILVGEAVQRRLIEGSPLGVQVFSEFLDLSRFPGEAHKRRVVRYLAEKYAEAMPDVVVAAGPDALRMAIGNRSALAPGVPIVFCCASPATLATIERPADATGIVTDFDVSKTMALARRLQPDARGLVVIAGAAPFDRRWAEIARGQLGLDPKLDVRYLVGLSREALLGEVGKLSRDTIVILLTVFRDGTGRYFVPADIAQEVASVSGAPVYGPYDTYLGRGVVGGHMDTFDAIGKQTGDLVLRILGGEDPKTIPPRRSTTQTFRVDARQLARWGLSKRNLPDDTVVMFKAASLWDQYRWQMILVAATLLGQSLLIGGLIYQRRRRRLAEAEAGHRMAELAHMNRSATAGEMSASIAHEINQPLAAIVTNGNAGMRWLTNKTPDREQAIAAFKRIVADGHRASQVLETVRTMFKKGVQERVLLDINEILEEVLGFVRFEFDRYQVSVTSVLTEGLPRVPGDPVQLQQVVLNLVRNAVEAMASVTDRARVLQVRSEANEEGDVIIVIKDTGPGIDPGIANRIFEPFFTTKPKGMGMGLSICRSIVEAHGGRLSAAPGKPHGSVFEIALPHNGEPSR
jgi:signal transduction histidine kinase